MPGRAQGQHSYAPERDRRKEPRFEAFGIVDAILRDPKPYARLAATIVDVSGSGMQIELPEPLDAGDNIELRLKDVTVFGEVCNCRPGKGGRYRAGIRTSQVIASPLQNRHLPDVDLEPYLKKKGLTDAQRKFYTDHLETCTQCRENIEKAVQFLQKVSALSSKSGS